MKENIDIDINMKMEHSGSIAIKDSSRKTDSTTPGSKDNLIHYIDEIIFLVRSQTGHDFSSYKKNTIHRRIERRMSIHQINKMATYISFLKKNPQEIDLLSKDFLIGVSSFFRDPMEWKILKEKVIPALIAERAPSDPLRVWISGCSTGEEAYSFGIVFQEVLDQLKLPLSHSIQIFATDLDYEAIDKSREGVFSSKIVEDVSPERLHKYFEKVEHGYKVTKNIRDMIIFAQQNMVKDPPFTKIDILSCRNVLIYLTPEMQKKLIPLFHYSLNPGGFLFLGNAEAVGNYSDMFKSFHRKSRLYQRLQPHLTGEPVKFPAPLDSKESEASDPSNSVQNMQSLVDKHILQYYSPATVLVNAKGDILYITGRTGKYLEPPSGKVSWNIFDMARKGLNYKLKNAFYKTLRQKEEVTIKSALVTNEGGSQMVDIIVTPLKEQEALRGMILILFSDIINPDIIKTKNVTKTNPPNSEREGELERELIQTRQMWQTASTEIQIFQEESKSNIEELQSSNEELQSTNEELTTTKEELQSLNEALKAVNFELQSKLENLSLVANNMKNLLDSTEIPTLFLDNSLCVLNFSKQMSGLSRLIPSDIGRPITDITSDIIYPDMPEDVREVLETLTIVKKQVKTYKNDWFKAIILPYYTLDDKIEGVVITFIDITEFKVLEADLTKRISTLEKSIPKQEKE